MFRFSRRALLAAAAARQARRPNVVVVLAEGRGGAAGMLAGGLEFTRAYAACPDRAWLRASILAGRFPHSMRRAGSGEEPSLVSELRRAGYAAGCAGVWGCDCPAVAPEKTAEFIRSNIPNDFCLCAALEGPETEAAAARLLGALEETGLAGDTIVVFTSAGPAEKAPAEESVRARLAIRYPRRIRPGRFPYLTSHADLAPTLLGMCGLEVPRAFHGRDLSRLILDGEGDPPESVYGEGNLRRDGEWRMVIRGLDKLVVNAHMEVTHLYNLGQDPEEAVNLAGEPAERLKQDEMLALLRRWILRTGDRLDRR